MKHAWLAVLGGCALAPLVTWLPMLALAYPSLGLPLYNPSQGVDLWHMQTFYLTVLVVLALIVGATDKWLGVAVAIAGVTVFWRGARLDPTHSIMFGLGALSLTAFRSSPGTWRPRIRQILIGLGVFELLYVIHQLAGYDLLWVGFARSAGWLHWGIIQPYGTFGSVNAAAGYIAVLAPLFPWPLLIVAGVTIGLTHSLGGVLAFLSGVIAMQKTWWARIACALPAIAAVPYLHKFTQTVRAEIWGFALNDWIHTDPVLGYGLGGWFHRIPELQVKQQFFPTKEVWGEAHNEPLQWLCEAGVVGLILLGLWIYEHRAMFAHDLWGPSLVALAVNCVGWHPFHIVSSALLGIILVALATPHAQEAPV